MILAKKRDGFSSSCRNFFGDLNAVLTVDPFKSGALACLLMRKAQQQIVGVAHDDHVASGLAPSPAFGPEVENVVEWR
jgi:hypothetical protein